MDYDTQLDHQFRDVVINLVRHDTSATGYPCYIEAHIGAVKDKGSVALDLGNYIFRRFGLSFHSCPEYRGRGKKQTLRWFMSWDDVKSIRPNILKAVHKSEGLLRHREYLPLEFRSLIIQNTARGVAPQKQQEAV